ncbi:MAG: 23S rRNA (adenine(2503)-C(2))-methyltransferase RlmN [Bacteroidales bacterium]|nr:23S rRNA (adenine(2503)-C(2))-methyltransferase RlmN [Bacteroidales bacterium]
MTDIRHITYEELEDFLLSVNEKKFRAKQIWTWLWQKGVGSFDEMTNVSLSLRTQMAEHFTFRRAEIAQEAHSKDKTAKFAFRYEDGKMVEGVLIPSGERVTACVSSQVGCPLRCSFCATGTMGFIRNLHYSEIVDEFVLMNRRAQELYGNGITNIVFMGMGEPLLNFDNVMTAIDKITAKDGFGLSPTRITLSTAGVIRGIKKLADRNFPCGLAVSLHSAEPAVREVIMPVTEHNSLHDLQAALLYYHQKTGQRITFEYLLLSKVNDTRQAAEKLARYCRPFPVKINIIEYNETEDGIYHRSYPNQREEFINYLKNCNMVVNVRQSKGQDIAAACGQLVKQGQEATK